MDALFKGVSKDSRGSLYHIKQRFRLRSVHRSVMNNFNHVQELMELATQGFIALR
jgi:hypothetical protein